MDMASNPFAPGAGSQPPELTGRETILESARVTLDRLKHRLSDRSQILIGLRGVGKTVLLNRIEGLAREQGFETAFLEAPEGLGLPQILAPELRKLLLRLDLIEGTKHKLLQALGALRLFASAFQVEIGDVGVGVSAAKGVADSGSLDRDLTDMLVLLGEAAAEKRTVIAILIDELQYVREAELGALIAGLHRVAQRNLPVVLFGAGLPQLAGLMGNAKSYSERLFLFKEIGKLDTPDALKALVDPIRRMNVDITPEALEEIVAATDGYPYFLQEWGKHAWRLARRSPISGEDARGASGPAVAELDSSFFRVRFDRLTPMEKSYLRAMAELGPGAHRSGDVAAAMGRQVQEVAPVRAKVIAKGMAYAPAHGDTAFTVPMFDAYLKRVLPVFAPKPARARRTGDEH